MSSLTIDLPESVFSVLKRIADDSQRSVQDVAREVITQNMPLEKGLPPSIAKELAEMPSFSDERLWELGRTRLSLADNERLEELHYRKLDGSITIAERDEQRQLLTECDRIMLVRAQAASLSKERGYDVSPLLQA